MAQCAHILESGDQCRASALRGADMCIHHGDDPRRCQAVRDGVRCRSIAKLPRKVCRKHGGASLPPGPGHPRYSTGGHSRALPERLKEHYEAAAIDPQLLEHKHDVALVDTLLADTIARLDTAESGELWKEVVTRFGRYTRVKDTREGPDALAQLTEVIERGANNYATQEEIGKLLDRRQRLAGAERKREIELKQSVSSEQVMVMMARIVEAIQRIITDKEQRMQIGQEIAKIQYYVSPDDSKISVRERKAARKGVILALPE